VKEIGNIPVDEMLDKLWYFACTFRRDINGWVLKGSIYLFIQWHLEPFHFHPLSNIFVQVLHSKMVLHVKDKIFGKNCLLDIQCLLYFMWYRDN